ncbi:uncharacterized protein LOC121860217 [Homarus americanus]|uniref:uncharacterized protein LOC121860217 n=1 Tax=Homarus americanus TaxID=6706 RepID=UPI001C467004|nr:uncharacterized protein LOC121860217 [Homarus americanus]
MSVCHSINGIPSYDTGDQKTLLCLFSERRPRPRLTTRDEDAAIREALHLDICAQTVRSHLHEAVIQNRVPAIKERLTYQHRNGRLQFAQQYVGEDLEFWSRVVFTDEKTFASTNHGKIHLWRPNRMRYNRAHIYEVARSGHVTLNMWGYISQHGMGDIFLIPGRFTANKCHTSCGISSSLQFRNAISYSLLDQLPGTFIHDRCPIHTARAVSQCLTGSNTSGSWNCRAKERHESH